MTPGASPVWLPQARETKHANYATPLCARSTGGWSVRRYSLQKHDHLVEIQDLYFWVLGAKRQSAEHLSALLTFRRFRGRQHKCNLQHMFCGEEGWSRSFHIADQIRAASSAVLKESEEWTQANARKAKSDQPRSSERLRASPAANSMLWTITLVSQSSRRL